ncbi:hypothetical protein L484_004155 [Morus notabilis]|uniref:Uncharacterized protein n=1 Tax=Morus notabilis TaxID=981085 RepID=W9QPX9_9ROSA|nr:hypothetical protein L484_004155 [Morus notabilis]
MEIDPNLAPQSRTTGEIFAEEAQELVERANFWDVVGKGGSSFHPNRLNSRLHIGRWKVQQVRKNPFHGGFLQLVPVPLRAVLRLKKLNKGLTGACPE